MVITPIPHGLEDLIGKSGPRTPGLHMSQIYGDLYQDLEPKRFVKGSVPDPLRLEAGLAFESFLEDALRARLINAERPPEFTHQEPGIVEPILFNPDLIIFNGTTRVGEIKLTWASSRGVPRTVSNGFPPSFSRYFVQILAYCHCLEVNEARLITFFVMGDYQYYKDAQGQSKPCGPELLAWNITFTARELRENWQMLMNHAKTKGIIHTV